MVKKATRGLLRTAPVRKVAVTQHYAIDDFNELAGRKRQAEKGARQFNHDMSGWHKRPNDPHGRHNAFCLACGALMVVAVDPPVGVAHVYGRALEERCKGYR